MHKCVKRRSLAGERMHSTSFSKEIECCNFKTLHFFAKALSSQKIAVSTSWEVWKIKQRNATKKLDFPPFCTHLSRSLRSLSHKVLIDSRSKTTLSRSLKAQSRRPLATSASIVASANKGRQNQVYGNEISIHQTVLANQRKRKIQSMEIRP